jgi:hypothetical protein
VANRSEFEAGESMTMQPNITTVRPSLLRLLASLGMVVAGGAGAVWAVFGLRTTHGLVVAGVVIGAGLLLFVLAVVTQTPRLVIGPEGFVLHRLVGRRSRKWEEIDGEFAVIKIGWFKNVAYKLTAECKARIGKKPTSPLSGYDEAVLVDPLPLSAKRLAELLNENKKRNLPAAGDRKTGAAVDPALASETQAEGNGSPILRVGTGVLALLFAGILLLMAINGRLSLGNLVLMAVLGIMFGWYAVRGRRGLPRFLTKKLGA